MSEELEYHKGKVDILIYKGHDMRRLTPSNHTELNQWWICRHQILHKCPSKLLLSVANLDNIVIGSHVIEYVEHSHHPFRMKSYGLTNVSVLSSSDEEQNASVAPHPKSLISSRLNSGDFSGDFNAEAMDVRIQSTPADKMQDVKEEDPHQSTLDSDDYTDIWEDTSKLDARDFPIRKVSRRVRGLAPTHPPLPD